MKIQSYTTGLKLIERRGQEGIAALLSVLHRLRIKKLSIVEDIESSLSYGAFMTDRFFQELVQPILTRCLDWKPFLIEDL
jgi:hypothetical protein